MPKYALIRQVRLLKAFCHEIRNTVYTLYPATQRSCSWQKFASRPASRWLAWLSLGFMVSILGSYIFNSYARPYVSMSAFAVAYFSAHTAFSLSRSRSLSLPSHSQLRQRLSLARIPQRFICLLTVLWLITGSTMGVHSPLLHPSPSRFTPALPCS